jgi:hypothetical protein
VENVYVQPAFEWACERDDVELVKRLLNDRRVDPGYEDSRCISVAAKERNLEIVKLLLADQLPEYT